MAMIIFSMMPVAVFVKLMMANIIQEIAKQTLIIYLEADASDEQHLIERASIDPKPLYYRDSFLQEHMALYQQEKGIEYVTQIEPDDFVRWGVSTSVFGHVYPVTNPLQINWVIPLRHMTPLK